MPLGQGILGMLEAIPSRIEVTGREPTWRVTAGSFDAAWEYARRRFDHPVAVAVERRHRWWPRVTLTVTTSPEVAAGAPALADLRDPPPARIPAQAPHPDAVAPEDFTYSPLDDVFIAEQERRAAEKDIPHQRDGRSRRIR